MPVAGKGCYGKGSFPAPAQNFGKASGGFGAAPVSQPQWGMSNGSGATFGMPTAVPLPPPPMGKGSGTKMFVGNLPMTITNEALSFVFGSYGAVTNVHIMQGKSKSGQPCAFVEYADRDQAEL